MWHPFKVQLWLDKLSLEIGCHFLGARMTEHPRYLLGKIWASVAVSLLWSDLSKKSTFLFSYWKEYFNLGWYEKEVLAASLRAGKLSPPDCFRNSRRLGLLT